MRQLSGKSDKPQDRAHGEWQGLVAGNGGKQAETIRAEQAGQSDSLSVQVQAPSAVLMEASTGQTIYEKNADERRSPASITKIMT